MTGSGAYQTKPLNNFTTSYAKLVKKHYRKKRKDREGFEKLIEGFLRIMRSSPEPPAHLGHSEPWPHGAAEEGFDLRKLHFDMPGIRGAAGEGRLMYLIAEEERVVYLVWIYTHDEFEKRPPEREIRRLLQGIIDRNR